MQRRQAVARAIHIKPLDGGEVLELRRVMRVEALKGGKSARGGKQQITGPAEECHPHAAAEHLIGEEGSGATQHQENQCESNRQVDVGELTKRTESIVIVDVLRDQEIWRRNAEAGARGIEIVIKGDRSKPAHEKEHG